MCEKYALANLIGSHVFNVHRLNDDGWWISRCKHCRCDCRWWWCWNTSCRTQLNPNGNRDDDDNNFHPTYVCLTYNFRICPVIWCLYVQRQRQHSVKCLCSPSTLGYKHSQHARAACKHIKPQTQAMRLSLWSPRFVKSIQWWSHIRFVYVLCERRNIVIATHTNTRALMSADGSSVMSTQHTHKSRFRYDRGFELNVKPNQTHLGVMCWLYIVMMGPLEKTK